MRTDYRYHYIYKVTRFDGKYYVGRHSTDNIKNRYFGSGTYISRSLKKYGKDKHCKEILEYLPDYDTLKIREREIVNEQLLADPLCMNLVLGGHGGDLGEAANEKRKVSVKKYCSSDDVRKARSKRMTDYLAVPENKEKNKQDVAISWLDPLIRHKRCTGIRKATSNETFINAQRVRWEKHWADKGGRPIIFEQKMPCSLCGKKVKMMTRHMEIHHG